MITLNVKNLAKSYGSHRVFSGISFGHEQKSLGISGSNGSGKSTFLKCLVGLLRPSNGEVHWKKDDIRLTIEEVKGSLGYAAPYINLYDELSCRENLTFLSQVRHDDIGRNSIDKWIDSVGLKTLADQPFGTLSTGQQQRLRLASALFHEPNILLLDEPGSNLDEAGRSLINNIVESFRSPAKMLILASNNPTELALCDQIYSIEEEALV